MGFYSPQSLVADARRHGVTVRRPDVNISGAQADLEPGSGWAAGGPAGAGRGAHASATRSPSRSSTSRPSGGYASLDQLTRAVTLTAAQAEALATAGALDGV